MSQKTQGHEIDRPLKEKFQCWHANSQYFEPVVKKSFQDCVSLNTILDTTRVLPPEEITDHFDEFNTNLKKAESILQTEEEQHSSICSLKQKAGIKKATAVPRLTYVEDDKRDVTKGHLALTIEDGILPAALPECGKQEFKLTTVAATSNTDFVNQVSQQCYILHSTILLHHFSVSLPTTIPFLSSISIDFANFCSTNIDTSPASALPLSSITSYPITLLDEYPSLSSFLHIHSTIILFSLLHPSVPLHQSIKSKAGHDASQTLDSLLPTAYHQTAPRQRLPLRCDGLASFWGMLSTCGHHTAPIARKEDTSWMSTSIAAEANAVGSSAAPHIRDSCRDLFFLLSSPASIEHYLIPSFRRASPTPTVVHRPPSPHKRLVPLRQ
ncbi:hypothetical protein BLNAU_21588 [Blattamonas nauphoetae]|uniref:Uncharacterized protein n=1 Tax=Blattamonas nauphoetae TaxID=2049346 RepID=A0ABQ9WYK1_9EUKA|nr:hypothetical protein BLNAU_21588 [Blattamonas nauphoetae]